MTPGMLASDDHGLAHRIWEISNSNCGSEAVALVRCVEGLGY